MNCERTSSAVLAVNSNLSAHRLSDTLGDRQAETIAVYLSIANGSAAIKGLKNVLQFFLPDPNSMIANRDGDLAAELVGLALDPNPRRISTVRDGVRDQVLKAARERLHVNGDAGEITVDMALHSKTSAANELGSIQQC